MKYWVLLPFLFSGIMAHAGWISPVLQQRMDAANPDERIRIRIEFAEQVDAAAMSDRFHAEKVPVEQRAELVITELQQVATATQEPWLTWLKDYEDQYQNLRTFWIVNLAVMEATPALIEALEQRPEIDLIDFEDHWLTLDKPVAIGTPTSAKAIGGIEPGLAAINAPAMWALGYTGKGRKAFIYDTGVWPTHPAYSNRFLGNGFPYAQTWDGFRSPVPTGANNNHGTHVCGTTMGLDTATADTIGVAFKGYWIANDHVASSVAGLAPLTEMIASFEWAMDPDGNPATSYDVPDVINNSWRWYDDPDTVHCAGFIVNLLNSIEAAGIANVFSGGNFGPNNSTISSPQRINTNEVNTFCVGSVNGNSASLPISDFSSIGPRQCPGTGSLEIHPEVVAPGQNVRSAWGTGEYNSISGTSMASPHVSGAILLLKEAYPMASGKELMEALYYTAIDLGVAGEDNVYGNGVIDVFAAYQYLGQTYTPMPPVYENDLELLAINIPSTELQCGDQLMPEIVIYNHGSNALTAATIEYSVNGGTVSTSAWTGNLTQGQQTTFTLPQVTFSAVGPQEFWVKVINSNPAERDTFNNQLIQRFYISDEQPLPFVEDFDQGIDPVIWLVDNEDGGITWDTVATAGLGFSTHSAWINFYDYLPRESQRDGLISPQLQLPFATSITLEYDYAWQQRTQSAQLQDTFQVSISTDCGSTWDLLFENAGSSLSTHDTTSIDFYPEFAHHWGHDSLDLNAYVGETVLLKFTGINRGANNFFLDNINVYADGNEPVGVEEEQPLQWSLYPNPSEGEVTLELDPVEGKVELSVYNVVGAKVWQEALPNSAENVLNWNALPAGVYWVQLQQGERTDWKQIILQ